MVCILATLLLASAGDSIQGTLLDGIAAVVGGELILRSDVEGLVSYELERMGSTPDDSTVRRVREEALRQLIDDRLLVNYAREETLTASADELEQALQERIQQIRARFPTESAFMAQLEAEGLTMARFRELQRRVVEEQVLKGKLQERLRTRWRVQVTDAEVRRFCEERADEIPDMPPRVQLREILLRPGPPVRVRAVEDSLLQSLRARLAAGERFEDLAREYSQDATARAGGDLGYFPRGSMVPEFERAVEALEPGEVSDVVETRFGLHLIQLLERDAKGFRARHLIRVLPKGDAEAAERLVAEIRERLATSSFEELARAYSSDPTTRDRGGLVGIVVPSTLGSEALRALLDTLPEQTLSPPLVDAQGWHLYWIDRRYPAGKPPCEEIAAGIRDHLAAERLEAHLEEFLEELRSQTYIEVFE